MGIANRSYYVNQRHTKMFNNSPCWNEYGKVNSGCAYFVMWTNKFTGPCRLQEPDKDLF